MAAPHAKWGGGVRAAAHPCPSFRQPERRALTDGRRGGGGVGAAAQRRHLF
jgi:hypothetical protein